MTKSITKHQNDFSYLMIGHGTLKKGTIKKKSRKRHLVKQKFSVRLFLLMYNRRFKSIIMDICYRKSCKYNASPVTCTLYFFRFSTRPVCIVFAHKYCRTSLTRSPMRRLQKRPSYWVYSVMDHSSRFYY